MNLTQNWDFKDGGFWFLNIEDRGSGAAELQVHLVDNFTEKECATYHIEYDPEAGFGLYIIYEAEPESILLSLHYDLEDALHAGEEWLRKRPNLGSR